MVRNKGSFSGIYWNNRWDFYLFKVAELVEKINPSTVLEIGTCDTSLCLVSDTLDINSKFNPTYHHDARVVPYPIEDKKYDLVIATQVWEHLGDSQLEAFNEVRRISRSALLSFPYRWTNSNEDHNNIDEDIIAKWTDNYPPKEVYILPENSEQIRHKRILYYWVFNK